MSIYHCVVYDRVKFSQDFSMSRTKRKINASSIYGVPMFTPAVADGLTHHHEDGFGMRMLQRYKKNPRTIICSLENINNRAICYIKIRCSTFGETLHLPQINLRQHPSKHFVGVGLTPLPCLLYILLFLPFQSQEQTYRCLFLWELPRGHRL